MQLKVEENAMPKEVIFYESTLDNTGYDVGMPGAKRSTISQRGRLKLISAGLILILIGGARMWQGIQVVIHSIGQPVFSWGLIAAGILCIFLGVLPASLVGKIVKKTIHVFIEW